MPRIAVLLRRAMEVRAYLERDVAGIYVPSLREFPVGCCKFSSLLLLQWLRDEEGVQDAVGANGSRQRTRSNHIGVTHFWIERNGLVLDITGDQFPDGPSPVFV